MIDEIFLLITTSALIFLYISWFVIAALPKRKFQKNFYPTITVIIPAYNEEENIKKTVNSVLSSKYPKNFEIIIVDDGSEDKTADIVKDIIRKNKNVRILKGGHNGKAKAINFALRYAKGEILVVLDADTLIESDALEHLVHPLSDKKIGAVATVLRVRNSEKPLVWFQHLEYALSTSWRYVVNKINGLCIVPGFCAFRKSALTKVGGFRGDTAVEDYDICLHLVKAGYKIGMASSAIAYTRVPETFSGLMKQRMRWNRGTIQTMKKHSDLFMRNHVIGIYTMPTQLYWFVHSLIYIPVLLYQMIGGYFKYFVVYGNGLSIAAIEYFVKWFTIFGMFDFIVKVYSGIYPASLVNVLTIIVFILSNLFLIYSILKFSGFDLYSLMALVFFFPYCITMLVIYAISLAYEVLSKDIGEKWEKNN